jgi:DNA-directed RNA polymerase subunit RPC12/RpoP
MSGTQQFPCAQCGAKLEVAPGTTALQCVYCGAENTIAATQQGVVELDYRSYLERVSGEANTADAQRVKCERCAAETTAPQEATAGVCPFCGASMVFAGQSSRLIRPQGVLPFKVTRQRAFAEFRQWIRKLWFAPNDLKQYAAAESKLVGVYTPYWTYDSDTTTRYEGQRGEHYYETERYTTTENGRSVSKTRQVQRTRWYPASGQVANRFDDVLVVASNSLPRAYADQLQPWDLDNLVDYADEYLSGFRAESYQVSLADGFETAKDVMQETIDETIRRDIGGDEQRIHSRDTRYGAITFKHILLPVWLSAYRYRGRIFRILINARTGEIQGERPYSRWKIAGAILLVLALVGAVVALRSGAIQIPGNT